MKYKRILSALLVLSVILCLLSACGGKLDADSFTKDALDAYFLGTYSDLYLKTADVKESEAKELHQKAIEQEVEAFANTYSINMSLCGEKTRTYANKIFEKLMSKVRYEVVSSSRSGDSYLVTLCVTPLDSLSILQRSKWEEVQTAWLADYADLSELDEQELEEEWAERILNAVEECMSELGYLPEEEITVQVEKINGGYAINDIDLQRVGALALEY